jgi:acyl-CoA reductase-like NAD-dependent aldehyde dehydrogenase
MRAWIVYEPTLIALARDYDKTFFVITEGDVARIFDREVAARRLLPRWDDLPAYLKREISYQIEAAVEDYYDEILYIVWRRMEQLLEQYHDEIQKVE